MTNVNDIEIFLNIHQNQLIASRVPEHFWTIICAKLKAQQFDSGNAFNLIQIDYEGTRDQHDPSFQLQVKLEDGIKANDSRHIYLIDHAWTFRVEFARRQLLYTDDLRHRMGVIVGSNTKMKVQDLVDDIFNKMWRYTNIYSVVSNEVIEARLPVWYIMDEVGSAILHSDEPNFRMVPFVHVPENISYSLIFPIKDVEFTQLVTRDFAEGITDDILRKAYLLPWQENNLSHLSFKHVEENEEYLLSGHIKESLPNMDNIKNRSNAKKDIYKVFTEYEYVKKYLTHERFVLVHDESEADILWYTKHFKDFETLSAEPDKYINQFPFEYVLTIKDILAIVSRRLNNKETIGPDLETQPRWLPTTYNLKTETVQFVSYFQNRAKLSLDNHWIVKPFNLARSLDTHITNNLSYITRLFQTGPKIAQKYIENPVLFDIPEIGKIKFDVRYVLLLKSVQPLEVYIYKNFFLRFANKPFALDNLEAYEQHFTVMNYTESANVRRMLCAEFIQSWSDQYASIDWSLCVEQAILSMFRELFERATSEAPPGGLAPNPQSRALYAADVMLKWSSTPKQAGLSSCDIEPQLLEVNWMPDCQRACQYYEDFYNDVFSLLFLDEFNADKFHKL